MAEAFKFIHASDLNLDQPMKGIVELPAHLKTTLANAPYDSATRIFDLAIAERVDFVLLAGNLLDIELGGPRASAFLLSQFERLLDKEIEVFWCAGEVDHPDRWPSSIELPENVTIFGSSVVEDVSFEKGESVVATIYGVGYDPKRVKQSELITPHNDGFSIALAHGEFDAATLSAPGIQYWALGGRHKATKLDKTGSVLVIQERIKAERQNSRGHMVAICAESTQAKKSELSLLKQAPFDGRHKKLLPPKTLPKRN